MSAGKLSRAFPYGSSAGFWMTADTHFYLIRLRLPSGARVWEVLGNPNAGGEAEAEADWLEESGLSGTRFPTRRAALERLQDALQLREADG